MLLKCYTQYVSKFGNLISGHRAGKGQFSFQPQRRSMSKNVQTIVQLPSFHLLVRLCSKSFKLRFSSTWIKNFQMYKLGLKKAKEPEIKLPTFIGSQRKQGDFRKTSTSVSLTTWKSLCGSHKLWKILKEMGISDNITCLLRNLHAGQGAMVRTLYGTTDWLVQNSERSMTRLYIVTLFI